ncbi:hypothetical protein D3C73_1201810 [compost metagenome]
MLFLMRMDLMALPDIPNSLDNAGVVVNFSANNLRQSMCMNFARVFPRVFFPRIISPGMNPFETSSSTWCGKIPQLD